MAESDFSEKLKAQLGDNANAPTKISVYFVCGGKYHDIDYVRAQVLGLLLENPRFRTKVGPDYSDIAAITAADVLITYTIDVIPDEAGQKAIRDWLRTGKRWFALHATNSILAFTKEGLVDSPRTAPILMEMLGSQFIAHPPVGPYPVKVENADHPLVQGVKEFVVDGDELYLSEYHGDLRPLLYCENTGPATGFVEEDWPVGQKHWVAYLKDEGQGQVYYLTLGHRRSHYDMEPIMTYFPKVEVGAWANPEFHELMRRGLRWLARDAAMEG